MSTTSSCARRELAHRQNDGIDITLFWNEGTTRVAIDVFDSHSGERLEFEADGRLALYAFNHPYAYAALRSRPPHVAIAC
jgi:hypothetical protein